MASYSRVHRSIDMSDIGSTYTAIKETANRDSNRASPQDSRILWEPKPLKLWFLLAFGLVAASCVVGLGILQNYSTRHHGLALITTDGYSWTYGPTAVIIIITSFWRLVDYHCKALAPWTELDSGPCLAHKSVWLDHISGLLPITLVRAITMSHWTVVASIIGFLLLKLVTLASTGLLLPVKTIVGPVDVAVLPSTRFDNISAIERLDRLDTPDPAPVYNLYAAELGLQYPDGLAHSVVYETFKPTEQINRLNATMGMTSKAFIPEITCSVAEIELAVNWTEYSTYSYFTSAPIRIQSPQWSCVDDELNGNIVTLCAAAGQLCPARQLEPVRMSTMCTNIKDGNTTLHPITLMAIVDVLYEQLFTQSIENYTLGSSLAPKEWFVDATHTSAVLCQASYHLEDVTVLYNLTSSENQVLNIIRTDSNGESSSHIPGLTPSILDSLIGLPAAAGNAMFGSSLGEYAYVEELPDALPRLIAMRAGGDYKTLLRDPILFAKSTEEVLSELLAHSVHYHMGYKVDGSDSSTGQLFYSEDRLRLQIASLAVMSGGLSFLIVLTVMVLFLKPSSGQVDNPEQLLTVAGILRQSHDLIEHLSQIAGLPERQAQVATSNLSYRTNTLQSGIKVLEPALPYELRAVQLQGPPKYYSPFTLSIPLLLVTLMSAPIIIILLEVIQRLSDPPKESLQLWNDISDFEISALTRYIPALVMLTVATLYNCLDFNTAVLAPYSTMYRSSAVSHAIQTSLLSALPPVALLRAFRAKYWASVLTSSAAMIGSVLTIVVSGLYSVQYVAHEEQGSLILTDSWNMSFQEGLSTDNAASVVAGLSESAHLAFPLFTYEDLAIPRLEIPAQHLSSIGHNFVTAKIPVLRGQLFCAAIDKDTIQSTDETNSASSISTENSVPNETTHYYKRISFNVPLSGTCRYEFANGTMPQIRYNDSTSLVPELGNITYYARFSDLVLNENYDPFNGHGLASHDVPDNPANCPSIVLVWAYFDAQDSSRSAWNAKSCEQRIQRVDATVTFSIPSMAISADMPPILHEDSAIYLSSKQGTAFSWRLQSSIDTNLHMVNWRDMDEFLTQHNRDSWTISNFFQAAFFGRTPISLTSIQAQNESARENVFDHLHMFYRRYMAQYISANMRVAIEPESERQVVNAAYSTTRGTPRIVQNRISKIVLQSMLAYMFVCAAMALSFNRYRWLTPWNPCTIFGVMVLFSGSEYLDAGNRSPVGSRDSLTTRSTSDHLSSRMITTGRSQTVIACERDPRSTSDVRDSLLSDESEITANRNDTRTEGLRFRLGWWHNGVYRSKTRPKLEEADNFVSWRYGIDVLGR